MRVQDTHALDRVANAVLSVVMTGINTYGTKSVTTVGHSFGAALSLLDAVFLPRTESLTLSAQVGNQDFANYVDSKLAGGFTRIPTMRIRSPSFLADSWASNALLEKLIDDGQVWKWRPGQDNTDAQCGIGDASNIFDFDIGDHGGPYNGIDIDC